MNQSLKLEIEKTLKATVYDLSVVNGGDINDAFHLSTSKGSFFVKTNQVHFAADMFAKEAKGLQLLADSHTLLIPDIIAHGSNFLILEYISSGNPKANFWETFGAGLAKLHKTSNTSFGLDHQNYIGSLPQSNLPQVTGVDFLIKERFLPQINLAQSKTAIDHATIKAFEQLFKKLNHIIPEEPPALIHGDLWSGNFMVSKTGEAVLIDPSVSFSLREFDLAMARLFGGFSEGFFSAYQSSYPSPPGLNERIEIYQLYYLLVHVNLFGGSYLRSVKSILSNFV